MIEKYSEEVVKRVKRKGRSVSDLRQEKNRAIGLTLRIISCKWSVYTDDVGKRRRYDDEYDGITQMAR